MAQTKTQAPYDPVKSVVGMWNGAITRLGYFFKDPANYGELTNAVLSSTSRRYQDALDDCEIQILEAKWYLEYQLKLNKEKREAAQVEKEDITSAKRKLAEFQEVQKTNGEAASTQEQPAKRQRVGDNTQNEPIQEQTEQKTTEQRKTPEEIPAGGANEESVDKTAETTQQSTDTKGDATAMEPVQSKEPPDKPSGPAPVNTSVPAESRPSTSYGGREPPSQSGQNTPATAAEEFNFESMFGEPSGDPNDAATSLNFDNMDLANGNQIGGNSMDAGSFNDPNGFNLGDTSLNNLLPGLESYAKQSGEHGDGAGGFDFGNAGGSVDNEFALPDLGTSTFDDFLNDNTFGDGGGGNGGDDFLKDGEMMNIDDFDASFFDAA